MAFNFPVLIGDIGGTNARFSIVIDAHSGVIEFEPTRLDAHKDIETAIQATVLDKTAHWPRTIVLAIAAPLFGDEFPLTNGDWVVRPEAMIEHFELDELVLMNDFAGQALAAISLDDAFLEPIGLAVVQDDRPKVILGPGTGLGIANAIKANGSWVIVPGEGGHIDLGPRTKREMAIWPNLEKADGRMSAELAVCGRGITNLYKAILATDGHAIPETINNHDISKLALEQSDNAAIEAIDLFATFLGRIAGDMALLNLSYGGIFIAGGIARQLLPVFQQHLLRDAMEDKAPHGDILRQIPIMVMTHPTAALVGLAAYVQTPELFVMDMATLCYEGKGRPH